MQTQPMKSSSPYMYKEPKLNNVRRRAKASRMQSAFFHPSDLNNKDICKLTCCLYGIITILVNSVQTMQSYVSKSVFFSQLITTTGQLVDAEYVLLLIYLARLPQVRFYISDFFSAKRNEYKGIVSTLRLYIDQIRLVRKLLSSISFQY